MHYGPLARFTEPYHIKNKIAPPSKLFIFMYKKTSRIFFPNFLMFKGRRWLLKLTA